MTRSGLGQVARWVRRFWGQPGYQELTDRELLRKYVRDRDEEAFAVILRRHGAWVLSLCRRVLGSDQDAEDAFQATWLVLARKAGSLRPGGILSNWLHGVAYKTALKARTHAWRRLKHEHQAMTRHEAADNRGANDQLPEWIEEELERLPAKLKNPLLLCYYEGKTREEAARELQCSPGAIKSSLERGTEMLRSRLTKRGLACTPAALATVFAECGAAAGPAALMSAT